MQALPLVSVITPSFNSARFIQETIDSVYAQDYPKLEHIIVDGGSTDGTLEVLQGNPHLDWVSEPDRGQSHALNKGFLRARGEIIGWLNADDTYNPGTLLVVTRWFEQSPSTDVVYSDCRIINENSLPIRLAKSQQFDLDTLLLDNYIYQPTVFFRRRVFEGTGAISESLQLVMDWEYWIRAGLRFAFQYLPGQILANFRFCSGTKTAERGQEAHLEWVDALDEFFRNLPDLPRWRGLRHLALSKAWGRYYMAGVYRAHQLDQRHSVRRNLLQAVARDPTWALNLGTWSIAVDAILGREKSSVLRRLVSTVRKQVFRARVM